MPNVSIVRIDYSNPAPPEIQSGMVSDLTFEPCAGEDGSLVGRGDLIRFIQNELVVALDEQGRVLLLSGEPGIGKTRCAEEIARFAEDQGWLVIWGRCYEQPGTPPFWPWIRILEELASVHSDDELRVLLGRHSKVIGDLVPEIAFRLDHDRVAGAAKKITDRRFILFEAISTVLSDAATVNPLLLVIDDLHWADASSLSLLEFLAKQVGPVQIMIFGAYRDVEVTRTSPLMATLGELSYSDRVRRERMIGLDFRETEQLAERTAGFSLPSSVSEAIFHQTDGNPLFVKEVAQVFAEEQRRATGRVITVDVPDGIREAIGRRLDRLSDSCNDFLTSAAVAGRDFDAGLVACVMGSSLNDALPDVDSAVQAGFLEKRTDELTKYRFTHAVIRETLYDELPTLERITLHREFGYAILKSYAADLVPHISQIAYHFCEAAPLGDYEIAADYCLRSAEEAERVFAFEQANRLYDDAIRMLTADPNKIWNKLAHAYVRKGRMLTITSHFDRAVESFSHAAELAQKLEMPELFAECITESVRASSNAPQQHRLSQLEHALRILPASDFKNRSKVLAHLAFALRSGGDIDRMQQAGEDAIRLARQLEDPTSLAIAIRLTIMGLRREPATLQQRVDYGREMVDLCAMMDDPEEVAECWYWHLLSLLEAGLISEFEGLLENYADRSNSFGLERHAYQAQLLAIALTLLRGEWPGVRDRIENAHETGSRLARRDNQQSGDGAYGAQMFLLNRELGAIEAMRPLVRKLIEQSIARPWAPGLLLMCCELGFEEEANRTFNVLAQNDFADLARDDMWVTCIAFCAEACAYLKDVNRAVVLYRLLLPYADQTINHPAAVCFGSASRYLGLLAVVLGKDDTARLHYDCAIRLNRAMGAWPALARTQLDLAQLLITQKDNESAEIGRELLVEAEQLAARFKMVGLTKAIGECQHNVRRRWPDGLTDREVEVLGLIAIGRSNKDISKVLAISLSTVATHIRSIFSKTGASNRTEAAAYATRQELN